MPRSDAKLPLRGKDDLMPLFFFDFTFDGVTEMDEIGTEFCSLERAYIETCQAALDVSIERLRNRSDPHRDSVEIFDADRRPLMQVPFSEVLSPAPVRRPAARPLTGRLIAICAREVARGRRLRAEVGEEVRQIQIVSKAIRANLDRLEAASARSMQGLPSIS